MIPHETIDEVRQAADIVDIISDYVNLRQAGRSFKALSPFTQEKTPSFVVSPEKQIYKCFSSGKGGNVFSFVMEMEKVSFPEAVELVAKRSGIDISRFTTKNAGSDAKEDTRTETLRWAARHFHSTLEADHGSSGYAYLAAKRGLTAATIKSFGLGYAPPGWDHLLHAAKTAGIDHKHLESLGLITENRQKRSWYDTFRNRVIFPIFSIGGQVVGFGGRTLEDRPDTPKYLNSQESSLFEKSKLLYGLHAAKNEIRRSGRAILVEGYMDVLALHQAGITSAVASCGTALTRYQAKIIRRYAKKVLFVYDADPAGRKSMMAGIDILLSENLTPVVLVLPPGEDPDSFVRREGKEKFLEFSGKESLSFLDFQIRFHREAGDFDTPEEKADAIRSMAATIGRVPDPLRRELYLQELSEKLGISLQALHELQGKERPATRESARRPDPKAQPREQKPLNRGPISVLEKTFVKALIESTAYGNTVLEFAASHETMLSLRHPAAEHVFRHMVRRYHEISDDPDARIDMATEIGLLADPEAEALASGLLMDQPVSSKWLEKTDLHADSARRCLAMFLDAFKNLILEPLIDEKDRLTEAIRTEAETSREIELSKEKIALDKKIRKTALELNAMIASILDHRP
ncbi:DNA primase [Chlorobium sp. N1]|uniref:DNA primase n=1 Tax=Chlorobium sp. N1 TaxID=2491138 RepID=UPI00103A98EB|nr:DNA primase [Chlorobium sp. N1]TCD48718.1 DNA primase [Chlorobium sp. N1]